MTNTLSKKALMGSTSVSAMCKKSATLPPRSTCNPGMWHARLQLLETVLIP
jgi:hypothetical protein